MSIEAMKQALEALRLSSITVDSFEIQQKSYEAIMSLKEAIAEAEKQEPVAWMYPDDLERFETSETFAQAFSIKVGSPLKGETVPLYTHPPKREWVGLTDEEIISHTCECIDEGTFSIDCAIDFALSLQESLRIKNDL